MKTFLIDEELRDKLVFYVKDFRELGTGLLSGLRLDAAYRRNLLDAEKELANLPEDQPDAIPIPTVEEIANHIDLCIDLWFRTVKDKPWSFIVEDLAGSIHSMLTARLKGADHE
jgi:hypothetical protein